MKVVPVSLFMHAAGILRKKSQLAAYYHQKAPENADVGAWCEFALGADNSWSLYAPPSGIYEVPIPPGDEIYLTFNQQVTPSF